MPSAKGFAVVCRHGHIATDTVQTSARGAMVNGLVVYAGVVPTANWTDDMIAEKWADFADPKGLRVAEIRIETVE